MLLFAAGETPVLAATGSIAVGVTAAELASATGSATTGLADADGLTLASRSATRLFSSSTSSSKYLSRSVKGAGASALPEAGLPVGLLVLLSASSSVASVRLGKATAATNTIHKKHLTTRSNLRISPSYPIPIQSLSCATVIGWNHVFLQVATNLRVRRQSRSRHERIGPREAPAF